MKDDPDRGRQGRATADPSAGAPSRQSGRTVTPERPRRPPRRRGGSRRPSGTILAEIGEDPDRPGLVGTPARVHRMYAELTAGYRDGPDACSSTTPSSRSTTARWWSSRTSPSTRSASTTCCRSAARPRWPTSPTVGSSACPRSRASSTCTRGGSRSRSGSPSRSRTCSWSACAPLGRGRRRRGDAPLRQRCAACAKPGMVMTTSAVLGLFRRNDKTRAEFFSHIARPAPRHPWSAADGRPTAQGAHRQARPRRPRPRREGARPWSPRRGLRGRLHGPPPDAGDGRDARRSRRTSTWSGSPSCRVRT